MTSQQRFHFGKRWVTGAGLLATVLVTSVFLIIPVDARAYATTTVNGTNPANLTLAVGETKIVTFQVVDAAFNPIPGLPVTIFYYTAYSYNGDPYFSAQPLAPPTNANGTGIPAYLTDAAGQLQVAITGTQPAVGRVVQFLIPLAAFDNANLVVNVTPPVASSQIGSTGGTVNLQLPVSEPISTGNGNYYYQHADFTIPGRGMPLAFQRNYNTLDNYSGPVGANWTHSYNVILNATSTGAVIKWGDGHGETFALTSGSYTPQSGVFSTLMQNSDTTFTLTQKNQTKYFFSAAGKLISIQDKNGNTISLTYDGSGNLSQITDTVGRNLTLSYDGSNRITLITEPPRIRTMRTIVCCLQEPQRLPTMQMETKSERHSALRPLRTPTTRRTALFRQPAEA